MEQNVSSNALEETLNNLSFQLLTGEFKTVEDLGDALKVVEQIKDQALTTGDKRMKIAYQALDPIVEKKDVEAIIKYINNLITATQQYLNNPSTAVFPNEKEEISADDATWKDALDSEFLGEFIEKYAYELEQFESKLIEFQLAFPKETRDMKNPDYVEQSKQLNSFTARFLHTLKGDAGSIGLMGMNSLCHHVEDVLTEVRASAIVEVLIGFKEWAMEAIEAYSRGSEPEITPRLFWEEFQEQTSKWSAKSTPAAGEATSGSDEMSQFPPELVARFPDASPALLMELMHDPDLIAALAQDDSTQQEKKSAAPVKAEVVEDPEEDDEKSEHAQPVGTEYEISGEMDILADFIVESEDHLTTVESVILDAAGDYSRETVDTIFRGIHSIKGASGYFKLTEVTTTSHLTENILDQAREGKIPFDQRLSELVFTLC